MYTFAFIGALTTFCALSFLSVLTIHVFIKDIKIKGTWPKHVILLYVIAISSLLLAWYGWCSDLNEMIIMVRS
jgi:hypothetical protein